MICVNAGMIIGLVVISLVACIMIIIGLCQMRKKEDPVGFYNVIDPPKKEEISDIIQWNKKHGMILIVLVFLSFLQLVFLHHQTFQSNL